MPVEQNHVYAPETTDLYSVFPRKLRSTYVHVSVVDCATRQRAGAREVNAGRTGELENLGTHLLQLTTCSNYRHNQSRPGHVSDRYTCGFSTEITSVFAGEELALNHGDEKAEYPELSPKLYLFTDVWVKVVKVSPSSTPFNSICHHLLLLDPSTFSTSNLAVNIFRI
ncbi:hypothetical protein CRG98_000467 [Punica granatum]|uniref:Uncharacterized protein n=1 Tax=Punica granatum TaxID=22663 RepID=A0A2I0LES3_PUNGR|nr:hypothetical protein CRG98_000467 [Punica granatum]